MTLRIYNTATRQKESIETIDPGKVRMYVCGPTVYDCAHVGHLMSALVFDVIRRYLEFRGYQVRHVMNYTDVDDKIIQRANEQEADPFDLAEFYIQEFRAQLDDYNVLQATVNPRATQDMEMIIEMMAENPDLATELAERKAADPEFAADPRAIRYWFYEKTPYYDHRVGIYPVGSLEQIPE